MSGGVAENHLAWCRTTVSGRAAAYGVAGDGPPLVFLHGWALGHQAYKRALKRLVAAGLRVYAPALPGFTGSADLPARDHDLAGFAQWVHDFLDVVGVHEPVTLVGHSFGGGVAIRTAHDFPDRVGRLIVVNSIGGSAWTTRRGLVRSMLERPLWDWGLHLPADLLPLRQLTRVLPVIIEDAVPNLLRNPRAFWRVAQLARTTELSRELAELKRRRMPVVVLWGQRDTVIPPAATESLRLALGDPQCVTVAGNHNWLLAEPDTFGEVITNVVGLVEVLEIAAEA